ncbi:hypothetical protein [Noviherbaspirillum malthae]|jgi:hypothetical protein|uniref:hypothetical protein n=1 Tax=Noviherbaspirillum malthae TaxID=1260987 RepID=UPI001E64E614|nr:hypothetical protein [Noviherbaspirillum malthae]
MSHGLLNLDKTVVAVKFGAAAPATPETAMPELAISMQLTSLVRRIKSSPQLIVDYWDAENMDLPK